MQPVTETWSSHIRMVTVIQSVCPSTEIKFGKHLRCFEVGRVVFSGKCGACGISLLFSCAKGPAWYHCLWFGGQALHWVMSTFQLLLNPLRSTRQYGFPPQQFNDWPRSGMSNRWWQVMFTVYFCLWVWPVAGIKDPWSALLQLTHTKRMQMEWHANTLTISKYHMLSITILANGIRL